MIPIHLLPASDRESLRTQNGRVCFKNEKEEYHRDNDLPAIIQTESPNEFIFQTESNGFVIQEWFWNGKYHRENDLPAHVMKSHNTYFKDYGIKLKYVETYRWFQHGYLARAQWSPSVIIFTTTPEGKEMTLHWAIHVPRGDFHSMDIQTFELQYTKVVHEMYAFAEQDRKYREMIETQLQTKVPPDIITLCNLYTS